MKKYVIILFCISIYNINGAYSQSLIVSAKGGFAYSSSSDSEMGAIGSISLENKFNKYLTIGVNGKFGSVEYLDEDFFMANDAIIEERELEISNYMYALNICPKVSFINTDELIISLIGEFGNYWMESQPVIYFTDKISSEVTHKTYSKELFKSVSWGLHLEGQYYLTDRMNVIVSIGWNNYDIGLSMNKVNLENDWNLELNEKTNFLYFEIGIAYLLFGKDTWGFE